MKKHTRIGGFRCGMPYWDASNQEPMEVMVERVLSEHPGCVIVNGSDDWRHPISSRPEAICEILAIKPVALFHTGCSGIASSGVVVSRKDYKKMKDHLDSKEVVIYQNPTKQGKRSK